VQLAEIVRPTPAQSIVVPESVKQPLTSCICSVPVVCVMSMYPVAVVVNDPVTLREPEIVTLVQVLGSRPMAEGSTLPLRDKHDELTSQVPTTLPPQAVPF